jgi:hypothetical protein
MLSVLTLPRIAADPIFTGLAVVCLVVSAVVFLLRRPGGKT